MPAKNRDVNRACECEETDLLLSVSKDQRGTGMRGAQGALLALAGKENIYIAIDHSVSNIISKSLGWEAINEPTVPKP